MVAQRAGHRIPLRLRQATGRNRLNLWMAEPTPQQRAAENADLNQGDAAQDESTQEEAA